MKQLCKTPAGCEHPGCLLMHVRVPASCSSCISPKCTASEVGHPKLGGEPWIQRQTLLVAALLLPTLFQRLHSPRCIRPGSSIVHNTAVFLNRGAFFTQFPSCFYFAFWHNCNQNDVLKIPLYWLCAFPVFLPVELYACMQPSVFIK